MLRPQDSSTRERKSLNGLWRFRLDSEGEGRSARWFSHPLPESGQMVVPASFNDIAANATVRDYFGDIWYQTVFGYRLAGRGDVLCCILSRQPTERRFGSTTSRSCRMRVGTPRSRQTSQTM